MSTGKKQILISSVFQGGPPVMRNKGCLIFGSLLLFFFSMIAARAMQSLHWKDRGNYYEGIKERKKEAHLELISAAIFHKEELNNTSAPSLNNVKMKFFIPEDDTVFISVRTFSRHTNYWMQPKQKRWERNWNFFSWSRKLVLNHLKPEPQLQDLGAVALIGGEYSDTLAPIVLYQTQPPSQITAYRFIFRPPDTGDLLEFEWICHKLGENPPVGEWKSRPDRIPGGTPLVFLWDCANMDEGWYQLIMKGRLEFRARDSKVNKTYRLYHQPNIQ